VSQGPLVGEAWAGGTIDGALTRTVRDAAGVLDAISGPMPGDPYYAPPLPRPLTQEVGADPGRLRIGMVDRPDAAGYLDDTQCRAAVAVAAGLLESLGHHVEESAPAAMFDQGFARDFNTIIAADTEATLAAFETLLGRPIGDDEIELRNASYRRSGRRLSAVAYLQSRAGIELWARRVADWWTGHDLLLTPTVGAPPPELDWFTAEGPEHEGQRIAHFIPYTAQFNMTGQPAISLPLHWTPGGLPVGVQLVAPYGREDMLIRVASQLEQAAPWNDRYPPVHALRVRSQWRPQSVGSDECADQLPAVGGLPVPPVADGLHDHQAPPVLVARACAAGAGRVGNRVGDDDQDARGVGQQAKADRLAHSGFPRRLHRVGDQLAHHQLRVLGDRAEIPLPQHVPGMQARRGDRPRQGAQLQRVATRPSRQPDLGVIRVRIARISVIRFGVSRFRLAGPRLTGLRVACFGAAHLPLARPRMTGLLFLRCGHGRIRHIPPCQHLDCG
jgi:hypothetical protein